MVAAWIYLSIQYLAGAVYFYYTLETFAYAPPSSSNETYPNKVNSFMVALFQLLPLLESSLRVAFLC